MTVRKTRFDIREASKPVLLVLLTWLGLCLGFFFVVVRPKMQEYNALEFGTQPQREDLQRRTAIVQRHQDYLHALQDTQRDLETLRREVLATREQRMVDVQLELAELCRRFRIDLDSVTFDNDVLPEEELDRLVMVVPLEGGYTNLRKFLQAVEDSDKFLLVERVALGEGKEGGVMLQLNITLSTYFELPENLRLPKDARRGRSRRA